jgi:uncharacterized protein (DUF433 family)
MAIDPRFGFGRPTVPDRTLHVEAVQEQFFAGDTDIKWLAFNFDLEPQTVEAILRLPRLASA